MFFNLSRGKNPQEPLFVFEKSQTWNYEKIMMLLKGLHVVLKFYSNLFSVGCYTVLITIVSEKHIKWQISPMYLFSYTFLEKKNYMQWNTCFRVFKSCKNSYLASCLLIDSEARKVFKVGGMQQWPRSSGAVLTIILRWMLRALSASSWHGCWQHSQDRWAVYFFYGKLLCIRKSQLQWVFWTEHFLIL